MFSLIEKFNEFHNKFGLISDIFTVLTLGTITLAAFRGLFDIFPRFIAIIITVIALSVLSVVTYSNWQSLIGFIHSELYGNPPPVVYQTDPACQKVITAAENASTACGAYVRIIDDMLVYGKKSNMAVYRPRALRECVDRTNDLFTVAEDNGHNIPEVSRKPILEMIDAIRRIAQIMVTSRETDIPNSVATQQMSFNNSIENVRSACRVQVNN